MHSANGGDAQKEMMRNTYEAYAEANPGLDRFCGDYQDLLFDGISDQGAFSVQPMQSPTGMVFYTTLSEVSVDGGSPSVDINIVGDPIAACTSIIHAKTGSYDAERIITSVREIGFIAAESAALKSENVTLTTLSHEAVEQAIQRLQSRSYDTCGFAVFGSKKVSEEFSGQLTSMGIESAVREGASVDILLCACSFLKSGVIIAPYLMPYRVDDERLSLRYGFKTISGMRYEGLRAS